MQRKNTPELMNDGNWYELIVCALHRPLHRYGSCVNPLGIARGQSHSNFMLFQLETLLIGLFISWGVKPFSSVKIHRIQRISTGCISLNTYCLITCNIKSLFNVPRISHISRKISQVSRFPTNSPDSRNKFVFLPKQPLLELSPPGLTFAMIHSFGIALLFMSFKRLRLGREQII